MKIYPPSEEKELYRWRKKILDLVDELNNGSREETIDGIKDLFVSSTKEQPETRKFIQKWVEKSKLLRLIPPSSCISILMIAMDRNDGELGKLIVREVQKTTPHHPELPLFKNKDGETILQIAAKQDKDKFIQEVCKLNPLWLRTQDSLGNTPLHTASLFLSLKTIKLITKKYPSLVSIRNKNGYRPLDLEAGSIIKSLVTAIEIKAAHKKEKATYLEAVRKIKQGTNNKNRKSPEDIAT
jgi:hypothetical protein